MYCCGQLLNISADSTHSPFFMYKYNSLYKRKNQLRSFFKQLHMKNGSKFQYTFDCNLALCKKTSTMYVCITCINRRVGDKKRASKLFR